MKKIFTLIGIISLTATQAQIIISEIYGGGGSSSLALSNDYIILKNIGSETVSLQGATIQYAAENGNFTKYHALPDITLNPGQNYLIQEAVNVVGKTALPAPDFIANETVDFDGEQNAPGGMDLSNVSGRIALAANTVRVTDDKSKNIIDYVSYGTDKAVPVFASASNTAFKRVFQNTEDTFELVKATAYPVNSSTGNTAMSISTANADYSKFNFILNPFLKDNKEIVFGDAVEQVKIYDEYGRVVIQSPTKISYGMNLIELPKGKYTVTGMINNSPVSQQIVKD